MSAPRQPARRETSADTTPLLDFNRVEGAAQSRPSTPPGLRKSELLLAEEIEQEGRQQAEHDARDQRKVEAPVFAFDVDVTRKASEPELVAKHEQHAESRNGYSRDHEKFAELGS